MVDHCCLDRVQGAVGTADALDGADGFAVKLRQKQDAGIQGAFGIFVSDDNGTGTAIAFVAALLCSRQIACRAQPIQQRLRGGCIHLHGFPIEKKRHFHIVNPPRYMGSAGAGTASMRRRRVPPFETMKAMSNAFSKLFHQKSRDLVAWRVQWHQKLVDLIKPAFPDHALPFHPALHLEHGVGVDVTGPHAPLFLGAHKAAGLEDAQVPHEGRQGDGMRGREFGNGRGAARKLFDHRAAGRVGEGCKAGVEIVFHAVR